MTKKGVDWEGDLILIIKRVEIQRVPACVMMIGVGQLVYAHKAPLVRHGRNSEGNIRYPTINVAETTRLRR